MSVPTDSAAPLPIATSDPAVLAGETSVVRLGKRVRDWITGLSPAGATAYDSGAQAIIPAGVFTASGAAARRQGSRTVASGTLVASAATSFASAFAKIATLPTSGSLRPASSRFYTVGVFNAGSLQLMVTSSGDINARALNGTVSLVTGASIYLDGIVWDL